MHTENYIYHHLEQELHGYVAYDDTETKPMPAVLVIHDWSGRNEFACQKANLLADLGYVGFAVDMYGHARIGDTNEEKQALMQPIMQDRALLRDRIKAAYDVVSQMDNVDKNRIAVIGFCFGGLCALDLARSGTNIKGAISFHGLLQKPDNLTTHQIKAKILVLHGYDDPMVSPEQVNLFCKEMTEANVDWQVHMYGQTQHAFTNPKACDNSLGLVYKPLAEHRAIQTMAIFLNDIFA